MTDAIINEENVLDVLAVDPFTCLPMWFICEAIDTPDLPTPVHYRLLDAGERSEPNNLDHIRELMRTVKLFHKNGHRGVRFAIPDGDWKNGWLPLVDLDSPEGQVYVSTFNRFSLGLPPYTPEQCMTALSKMLEVE